MNLSDYEKIKHDYETRLKHSESIKNLKIDIISVMKNTFGLYENNIMPSFFEEIDSDYFKYKIKELVINNYPAGEQQAITQNILEFKDYFKLFFGSYSEYLETKLMQSENEHLQDINRNETESINCLNSEYSLIIVATYEGAKKLYENQLNNINDCFEYIASFDETFQLSDIKSSARFYITMFKNLMLGEKISGNFSLPYGKYFIERIYLDYGLDQLNLALKALSIHIKKVTEKKVILGREIAQQYGGIFNL